MGCFPQELIGWCNHRGPDLLKYPWNTVAVCFPSLYADGDSYFHPRSWLLSTYCGWTCWWRLCLTRKPQKHQHSPVLYRYIALLFFLQFPQLLEFLGSFLAVAYSVISVASQPTWQCDNACPGRAGHRWHSPAGSTAGHPGVGTAGLGCCKRQSLAALLLTQGCSVITQK